METLFASRRFESGNGTGACNRPALPVLPIKVGRVRKVILKEFPITHYREFRARWAVLCTRWLCHAEFHSGRDGLHPLEPPQIADTSAISTAPNLILNQCSKVVFQPLNSILL